MHVPHVGDLFVILIVGGIVIAVLLPAAKHRAQKRAAVRRPAAERARDIAPGADDRRERLERARECRAGAVGAGRRAAVATVAGERECVREPEVKSNTRRRECATDARARLVQLKPAQNR